MSSGVGLRPPLPLYFASKGMGSQRPTHQRTQKNRSTPRLYREPSPVAVGRLLGKITEESARPRDRCAGGLAAAAGPHARSNSERRRHPIHDVAGTTRTNEHGRTPPAPAVATGQSRSHWEKSQKKSPWFSPGALQRLAERTGLEPATSGVTGQHSNQLNYRSALELFQPTNGRLYHLSPRRTSLEKTRPPIAQGPYCNWRSGRDSNPRPPA